MIKIARTVYAVTLVLIVCSCADEAHSPKPENLVAEDAYIDLLVEMQLVKTYYNANRDSLNADSLKQQVFDRYAVTEEQYMNSHEYYQSRVKEHQQRIDKAIQRLEAEKAKLEPEPDSTQADSTDSLRK